MFITVAKAARFSPERPAAQMLFQNQDCRILVFGLEPDQSVPLHASGSTVLLQVIEGRGRLRIGDDEREVGPGEVAVCQPHVPHALAAGAGRLAVLAVIAPKPWRKGQRK